MIKTHISLSNSISTVSWLVLLLVSIPGTDVFAETKQSYSPNIHDYPQNVFLG